MGEAFGSSMAALLVKGSCTGLTERGWGSLNGFTDAVEALFAPKRSQEWPVAGRSDEGERLPALATAPAAATSSTLPPLLRFVNMGSNSVTGRRLRRGAVDMVRSVLMLGAGSTCGGGGGGRVSRIENFSSSAFCSLACCFLR
jgi:hypothetical protein